MSNTAKKKKHTVTSLVEVTMSDGIRSWDEPSHFSYMTLMTSDPTLLGHPPL